MNNHAAEYSTQAWQRRRKTYFEEHGYQCERCGATKDIQLHHLEYTHEIGTEPDDHLMSLCDECHNNTHKSMDDAVEVKLKKFIECPYCYHINISRRCEQCKKII